MVCIRSIHGVYGGGGGRNILRHYTWYIYTQYTRCIRWCILVVYTGVYGRNILRHYTWYAYAVYTMYTVVAVAVATYIPNLNNS